MNDLGAFRPAGTILHLFQCTNLGGMEQVTFRLMRPLAKRGFSFRIATPRPFGPGADSVRIFDPDARDFPYRGRFGWRDFPRFRVHVHALAADCSHIWITGTSAAALAAVKGLKQPKVLSHHYHHFEGSHIAAWARWRTFYELLCRDLDAVVYPSAFTRDEALMIAPWLASKARVVRNGVDVRFADEATRRQRQRAARKELGLPDDSFIVGNAGWLIQRKRFDVFLRVAAKVRAQVPESLFVICGGGEAEGDLKRLAANLGLGDSVRFMGWVKDLRSHYEAWDALLFNSDFDLSSSSAMEAAAEGCVVIASQAYGGLAELVEHRRTGWLFADHDIDALTSAVIEARTNPAMVERFRRAAADKLRADFSLERAADAFTELFSRQRYPAAEARVMS